MYFNTETDIKATTEIIESAQVSTATPEPEQNFNWRECWYPVCFVQDLPINRPYTFSLYDEPFVLFKTQDGQLGCLVDRCSHRAAKLSDGRIIDGKIECLYHGWLFSNNGQCLDIPQLPADAKIPVKACVQSFPVVERQGVIWMWAGEAKLADEKSIPTIPDLDKPNFVITDSMVDAPYNQCYFTENIIDFAHIDSIHNATLGNRKNAQPLEMEVIDSSMQGFRGKFRYTRKPNEPSLEMNLIAPNFITYRSNVDEKRDWIWGVACYSIPLSNNRCRIMVRNYRNFMTWSMRLKPRWLDHMFQNKIFEEDLQIIMGQEARMKQLGENWRKTYLPLKTSDLFVLEYRKWLDKFGQSLPYYQSNTTSQDIGIEEGNQKVTHLDRLSQHTLMCSSCNSAYHRIKSLQQICVVLAIVILVCAIPAEGLGSQVAMLSFVFVSVLGAVAHKLKTKFEVPHTPDQKNWLHWSFSQRIRNKPEA